MLLSMLGLVGPCTCYVTEMSLPQLVVAESVILGTPFYPLSHSELEVDTKEYILGYALVRILWCSVS